MFDKASLKLGLDKAILQSMNTSQGGKDPGNKTLTKKEIEDLLKKGAYGAIMDDDNAGDKFCEEDIDVILSRRTQVNLFLNFLNNTCSLINVKQNIYIQYLLLRFFLDYHHRSRKRFNFLESQLCLLFE